MYIKKYLDESTMLNYINEIQNNDDAHLEELICANIGLVYKVINNSIKKKNSLIDVEDLVQEGAIGLVNAIYAYDSSKGAFSSYAYWKIYEKIMRYSANNASLIRIPIFLIYDYYKYSTYTSKSRKIALANAGISEEIFNAADNAMKTVFIEDIGTFLNGDNSDVLTIEFKDDYVLEDDVIKMQLADDIKKLMNKSLHEKEAKVLSFRFGLDNNEEMTLEEVGKILGVTRERVRQIEIHAIRKLRRFANAYI